MYVMVNIFFLISTDSDKSFEVWIKRCEEVLGGKWLKFSLCGRRAFSPYWCLSLVLLLNSVWWR